jgi:hypothetical protein
VVVVSGIPTENESKFAIYHTMPYGKIDHMVYVQFNMQVRLMATSTTHAKHSSSSSESALQSTSLCILFVFLVSIATIFVDAAESGPSEVRDCTKSGGHA